MGQQYKDRFNIFYFIKKVDIFGEPIPDFNLAGRDVIKTTYGALISIVVLVITFMYGSMKYHHII